MNDTPETDKEWGNWLHKLKMPIESFVDFARKLERERDQWREIAERLLEYSQHLPYCEGKAFGLTGDCECSLNNVKQEFNNLKKSI